MKLKLLMILSLFFYATLLNAQYAKKQEKRYDPSSNYKQEVANKNYEVYQQTKERLELAGKGWKIRGVIDDERIVQEEFSQLRLLKVASKPLIKNMTDMDSLEMHQQFPLLLMLPPHAKLTNAYTFPATVKPLWQEGFNTIDLIPSSDFLKSTLVVTYLDYNNEFKRMTVLLSQIKNNKTSLLHREISYQEFRTLTVEEVLTKFYTAHNYYPKHNSMIRIGNNVYTFIQDNVNGTLRIDGTRNKFLMQTNRK